jgi:hypothetical protein
MAIRKELSVVIDRPIEEVFAFYWLVLGYALWSHKGEPVQPVRVS